jgi:peptidoglycan/xylan/chitin deacetylase (PgdA/CDA1 family)
MSDQVNPPSDVPQLRRWARNRKDFYHAPRWAAKVRSSLRGAALHVYGALARIDEQPSLRCLYAHNVFDDQRAAFEHLLRKLQSLGTFINAADVVRIARGERPLDKRYFHLSFDDGLENNYTNIFPILTRLKIPGLFFVTTQFVGADDDEVVQRWFDRTHVRFPARPLRWEWMREMAAAGQDFGSHTRTHARLSDMENDRAALSSELSGSKADIEQQLGAPCLYFSYPFGALQRGGALEIAIRDAGYEACFAATRGRVVPGKTDLLEIPRHQFEADWPWLHVRYFALGGNEART